MRTRTFYISLPLVVKFGIGGTQALPLHICKFCENRYSGSDILLEGVTGILAFMFCIFRPIWVKFIEFRESKFRESHNSVRVVIEFLTSFPHFARFE